MSSFLANPKKAVIFHFKLCADFFGHPLEFLCKRATSVAHLTDFSFEFFYEIFTEDA